MTDGSPILSVVIPVYHEQDNIGTCLRRLDEALVNHGHELLVCYDVDDDPTLDAVRAMDPPVGHVRLVKNDLGRGPAFAIRAGFEAARGDVVVVTMADLSDPPDRIPAMVALARDENLAVVAGSRYMPGGSQTGGPWLKTFLSRWAGISLAWIAGLGTHDGTTSFRAYRRDFLEEHPVETRAGFVLGLELTVKAHLAGRGVGEVPSTWVDREAGESRFALWSWLPLYLHWWFRAMAVPALVWASEVAALVVAVAVLRLGPLALLAQLLLSLSAILIVRRRRRRMAGIDVVLPWVWLHVFVARPLLLALLSVLAALALLLALGRRAPASTGTEGRN